MSSTPRERGHQTPSPSRSKQAKPTLLPLQKSPTGNSTLLKKPSANWTLLEKSSTSLPLEKPPTTNSTLLKNPSANSNLLTKPSTSLPLEKPSTTNSILLTTPSTSSPQNRNPNSNIRPIRNSLGITTSPEVPLKQGGSQVPIRSNNNKETGIVPFQRSKDKHDSRVISLPDDDPNISIDKLLAQWVDNINKAEQDFEEEELAFERAQARLSATRERNNSLRSLSPNKTSRLLDKAKGIIGQNQRLSPIKKRHNPL